MTLGRFYLAGPMRGYPLFNFPAFEAAAADLRSMGYEIVSPAEHDLELGFDPTKTMQSQNYTVEQALGWDFKQIPDCDGIILMNGWERSTGAKAELLIAHMCGKKILRYFEKGEIYPHIPHEYVLSWAPLREVV